MPELGHAISHAAAARRYDLTSRAQRLLRATSCQAPCMDDACRAIIAYLARRLGLAIAFETSASWQARQRALDQGSIDFGWICGAPYVQAVACNVGLALLAAPAMRGARYAGSPVYFSDVVVHRDSSYERFEDLAGTVWAYNEPDSHSGYHAVRRVLAHRGLGFDFFGAVVETGAHQASVELIRAGMIDGSAIDSTVLEWLCAHDETLAPEIRVIDSFGPSPMPPWVAGPGLPLRLHAALRDCFMAMHEDIEGRDVLSAAGIDRFAAVADADYDPIRTMLREACEVARPTAVALDGL